MTVGIRRSSFFLILSLCFCVSPKLRAQSWFLSPAVKVSYTFGVHSLSLGAQLSLIHQRSIDAAAAQTPWFVIPDGVSLDLDYALSNRWRAALCAQSLFYEVGPSITLYTGAYYPGLNLTLYLPLTFNQIGYSIGIQPYYTHTWLFDAGRYAEIGLRYKHYPKSPYLFPTPAF